MIESIFLYSVEDMPKRGWFFLVLLVVGVVAFYCKSMRTHKNRALLSILILYLGVILCLTVVGRNVTDEVKYELIPLWSWKRSIRDIIEKREYGMVWQIVVNILMFMPVGCIVYFLKKKLVYKSIFLCAIFSMSVEMLQLVFRVGLFEWDDVLHNTLGCLLGTGVGLLCESVRGICMRKCG